MIEYVSSKYFLSFKEVNVGIQHLNRILVCKQGKEVQSTESPL